MSSATSITLRPASFSALAVPPVETSSTPWPASSRGEIDRPVLSDTDNRARVMRRGWLVMSAGASTAKRAKVYARDCAVLPRIHKYAAYSGNSGSSRPLGAGARRRRRGVTEAPAHRRLRCGHGRRSRSARCGAGRRCRRGYTLSSICTASAKVAKVHSSLVRQQQDDAAAVRQPVGLDRGCR